MVKVIGRLLVAVIGVLVAVWVVTRYTYQTAIKQITQRMNTTIAELPMELLLELTIIIK